MSARQLLRALILSGLVVLFVGFVAAAAATPASGTKWDGERSTDGRGNYHSHLSVHWQLADDGSALLIDVKYSGPGDAVLTVEAVQGSYDGARTVRIEDHERLALPVPEAGATIRVSVETEHRSYSVLVEVREMPCDREEAREEWSSQRPSGDDHRIRLYVPDEDCERGTPARPTATPDDRPTKTPAAYGGRSTGTEAAPPSHDDVHETVDGAHDEAIDRYNQTHDDAIGLYGQVHQTVWETYDQARGAVWGLYEQVTSGDGGDGNPVDHAREDAGQLEDDLRRDADHVREDVESDAERVCSDAAAGAERIRDDASSDVERVRDDLGASHAARPPQPAGAVQCSGDGSEPPATPDLPPAPETPGGPETPDVPEETPSPTIPDRPGLPGDGGGETPSIPEPPTPPGGPALPDRPDTPETPGIPDGDRSHASADADADAHRDGTSIRVDGWVSGSASHGETSVSAERSVSAGSEGSTDVAGPQLAAFDRLLSDLFGVRKSI